jgi:glycoside hydrolase family 18
MKKEREMNQEKSKILSKIIITAFALVLVAVVLITAKNYLRDDITDRTNLVINHNNVTSRLQRENTQVYIDENGNVYLSMDDIENFFDKYIYIDEKYNMIVTTSDTKQATIGIDKKELSINGSKLDLSAPVIQRNGEYYLPISELTKVYNIDVNYHKDSDILTIDSLDRSYITMTSSKNMSVKYKAKGFSRTVDKVKKGESVVLVSKLENGWAKIRTQKGILGYVKQDSLTNEISIRQDMPEQKQIEGKVSLVWDYFSEYVTAPTRSGTMEGVNVVSPSFFTLKKNGNGAIDSNVGQKGEEYITWAHDNGYKVWAMVSNNSLKETTSTIMKDYYLREKLIENIIEVAVKNKLDGINIDFENMYAEDKDLFSKFIIELAPRLKEVGMVLSVDVTAPDGSDTWSLCFDRNVIGDVADYIVFMAYDQHGTSSVEAGTVAGYNWVEANIKKFLGQEDVEAEKIILGMPFYTRTWWYANGDLKTTSVDMKDVDRILPEDAQKAWDDALKQNYVKYTKNGIEYEMWIEDVESIKAKLSLIEKYKLAGASYWEYGREDEAVWPVIAEALKIK